MNDTELLIKLNRQSMSAGTRKRTQNLKFNPQVYPHSVEVQMRKFVANYLDNYISEIMQYLSPEKIEDYIVDLNTDNRNDAGLLSILSDEIRKVKNLITSSFSKQTEVGNANRILVTNIGFELANKSAGHFKNIFKKIVGFEYAPVSNWERDVISAWAENNYTLIQSLAEENIKEINRIVSKGVLSGKDSRTIYKELRKKNKTMATARVKLIARDQVAKLQGEFTKRRMKDAGFDLYIWSTSGDERVRDSHRALDNKICDWNDDSVYSEDGKTWLQRTGGMFIGQPGDDFQCRCASVPYTANIFEDIDNEIQENEVQING